jgi:3-hydroxyisobutyrate dehydrogenase-like beta-hydroxyacid dehydrogenase
MTDWNGTVGIAGPGRMGGGFARRLLAEGVPVVVLPGPRRSAVEDLAALGARIVATAAELAAASDLVMTALPSSDEVAAMAQGLRAGARPGLVHVDLTTGDPATTLAIAAGHEDAGLGFVDAGVSGTPEHAATGQAVLCLGGDPDLLARLDPLFARIARRRVRMGDVGAGHTAKVIMGFVGMAMATGIAEALTIARARGIDLEGIRSVVGETTMDSGTFQAMALAAMDGDTGRRKLAIATAHKDVGCLLRIAAAAGVEARVGEATRAVLGRATAAGHGADFVPALTAILSALDGVSDA